MYIYHCVLLVFILKYPSFVCLHPSFLVSPIIHLLVYMCCPQMYITCIRENIQYSSEHGWFGLTQWWCNETRTHTTSITPEYLLLRVQTLELWKKDKHGASYKTYYKVHSQKEGLRPNIHKANWDIS